MRMLAGTYEFEEFPNPIRVGKFVDSVERDIPGFQNQYSRLSEYVHPNARGTTGLYSTIDREKPLVNFGPQDRNIEPARGQCIANLSVTLKLFERSYNHLSDLMADFIALCEEEIPPLPTADGVAQEDSTTEN